MGVPNTFHQDCFSIVFSNMPSVGDVKVDMRVFDLYVKSMTLPDMISETVNSDFTNSSIRHPISRKNNDIHPLTIEFKASEDLVNYFILHNYIKSLRYGVALTDDKDFRNNTIKAITLHMKDNQQRVIGNFTFTNCLLTSLGSLNLMFGSADELTFPVSFVFEEMILELNSL